MRARSVYCLAAASARRTPGKGGNHAADRDHRHRHRGSHQRGVRPDRPLGIVLSGLAVADAVLRYFSGRGSMFVVALTIGVAAVVARYLFTSEVRQAFEQSERR